MEPGAQKAIAETLDRLIGSSRSPADLSKSELERLGQSLGDLIRIHPAIAKRSGRLPKYAGLVFAAVQVKSGKPGTWAQLSQEREREVRMDLKSFLDD